jgi:hypothetical protein
MSQSPEFRSGSRGELKSLNHSPPSLGASRDSITRSLEFQFLPGRGSHYSSKIRSFVNRNQALRQRQKKAGNVKSHDNDLLNLGAHQSNNAFQIDTPSTDPLADSQILLHGQLDPFQTLAVRLNREENQMLLFCRS